MSCLVRPGDFLAHRSTGRLVRVVAAASYSFLAWDATVENIAMGQKAFVCKAVSDALQWHHLLELQDWLVIGTSPQLLSATGPVGWLQVGEPMFLPHHLCLRGLPVTKDQILQLIRLLGGSAPAGADKRHLQEFLIKNILPDTGSVQELFSIFCTCKLKDSNPVV